MTREQNQVLYPYLFPVEERQVFVQTSGNNPQPAENYKAIVRRDENRLISIQRDSYQLVENSAIIYPLLEQLGNLETPYYFDQSHSFVQDSKMSLLVLFPELKIFDGTSDIFFGLSVNNSYDASTAVKIVRKCVRQVCTNGMTVTTSIEAYERKHTPGFSFDNIKENLEQTSEHLLLFSQRVEQLQSSKPTKGIMKVIEQRLGKRLMKYVDEQPKPQNLYKLLNYVTYYVSHMIEAPFREDYMLQTSKIFQL